MVDGGTDRLMVECAACGSVYAAREREDGDPRPIGKPQGCECGGTDFVRLSDDAILENDEDEPLERGDEYER
ncbi:hypothetical protein [Natrarchaeobius oligotrophus]|uniref:Uncharacterized protein n=1 Tax=Natrarchaeobius chitinivorans TaxID=1679083 RepID=A0A3N6MUS1_NATCH|nr:hypothetical protein [Natrarchaeobius chitinivorans]RQH00052.1 hypothetical protein EA472_12640 [Natrarchaeobius chitinivorans]